MMWRHALQHSDQILNLLWRCRCRAGGSNPESCKRRFEKGAVDHEIHRAVRLQHGPKRTQTSIGIGKMMQNAGANDVIEALSNSFTFSIATCFVVRFVKL